MPPPSPSVSTFDKEAFLQQRREAAKSDRSSLRPVAIEKTYRAAFEKFYANRPGLILTAWTAKERGMVRQSILSKWPGSAESAHKFIEWVVDNWYLIRGITFDWMKKSPPPEVPEIGFICQFRANVIGAYNKHLRGEFLAKFDDADQRETRRLMIEKGLPEDKARMEVAEARARIMLREELAKKQANVNHVYRMTKALEKRMRGRPAIDPRSETARRMAQERAAAAPVPETQEAMDEGLTALFAAMSEEF
ncbi:hypothetical protein BSQ44_05780 [Aquibium oceanicum]|uniref:Replication protein n=2 Tax=Aquibium oceanicum TaxID=1670800 RepID=A0A1L3SNP9_9HYPH|nr:hypothetical protein BSQ44_05780 [Aquibium oceanicum]